MIRNGLAAPGKPLDLKARAFFEPRFGYDFSRIRVHTDDDAARAARSIAANAFTFGHDIFFGGGRYRPDAPEGRQLLAHELAHVTQHGGSGIVARSPAGTPPRPMAGIDPAIEAGVEAAFVEHPTGPEEAVPISEQVLSPEDMYRKLTSGTAFREGVHEQQLLRYGQATRAMIQVIDGSGRRVAAAFGRNDGRIHAEQHAMKRLRPQLEGLCGRLAGGRLVVVVNQHVCRDVCIPELQQFAREFGLKRVTSHVFVREALTGSRRPTTPRTTFKTQTKPSVAGYPMERIDKVIYENPAAKAEAASAPTKARAAARVTPLRGVQAPPTAAPVSRPRTATAGPLRRAAGRVRAGVGRVPGWAWQGLLVALSSAVASYVRERERLTMLRDWNSKLREIRSRLVVLEEEANRTQQANPLDFVFANITIDVRFFRYGADGEQTHYRRTDVRSVEVSTEDRYENAELEIDGDLVSRLVLSQEFSVLAQGLLSATLETVVLLEDTDIREWIAAHHGDLETLTDIPLQEKIRLVDRLVSGVLAEEDFSAIWWILHSVTDPGEARDIAESLEPLATHIADHAMRYRFRSLLMDLRHLRMRPYATY